MINYTLKELDQIEPWGQNDALSLNWFALTDGELWLKFGNETVYEYSKEAINYLDNKPTPYNDYQLSRFIEDFTELFDTLRASLPEKLYCRTIDLKTFQSDAQKWLDLHDTDDDKYSDFFCNEYDQLTSWIYQRTFHSAHLIGGPHLSFFRRNDTIRIVWKTEYTLENGISIWTAKDGSFEMNYSDFIQEIKTFGQSFFSDMSKQIERAVEKEWGNTTIDKQRLTEEHKERQNAFYSSLALLEKETECKTNWAEIEQLYVRMINEMN